MPGTTLRTSSRLAAGIATAAMLVISMPSEARRGSAKVGLDNLLGTWSGSGNVVSTNGQSESIRCRVTYGGGSGSVSQNLVCASASYKLNVTAAISQQGDAISGTWQETTRGVGGNVSGTISGNQISATVSGNNFSAGLSIDSRGNRQNVVIQPQGGGDISRVAISFRR